MQRQTTTGTCVVERTDGGPTERSNIESNKLNCGFPHRGQSLMAPRSVNWTMTHCFCEPVSGGVVETGMAIAWHKPDSGKPASGMGGLNSHSARGVRNLSDKRITLHFGLALSETVKARFGKLPHVRRRDVAGLDPLTIAPTRRRGSGRRRRR